MKRFIALVVVCCFMLLLGACRGADASSDSQSGNSVSDDAQTATEVFGPERVVEVFSVEYEDRYQITDNISGTFNDERNGNVLPYRLYIPKDYSSSEKYPIILFLHGAGEIGTDNARQLNNIDNMFEYNGDIVSNAFILCPQSAGWWNLDRDRENDLNGSLGSAYYLLKKIMGDYSCDSDRVYVTGLSMGGYATWDLLERCGSFFAAGVPVCGGGNSANGAAFVDIPIKIYHGTADPTVSFGASEAMYNAIVRAGGQKVDFIQLEGVGHNAWDYAYADREMFCWMFAQSKASAMGGTYEYAPRFSIKDEKGNTVIDDGDVVKTSYRRLKKSDKMVIELTLNVAGRSKLNVAYKKSDGGQFTFYYGTQKVYSFTATGQFNTNVFYIADVFTIDNYLDFYKAIEKTGV